MPPTPNLSFIGLDEFVNKPVVENCKAMSSEEETKVVRKNDDALCIEEWVSDDEEEDVSQPKIEKKTVRPKAVNTACYVQNRVLVVKPHNKTPYELFHGRTPTLSFMRPFGYPVTILNIKDHLGKFNGNVDEGFFVGYSLNSKAFRVFNSRTRIVEENLYIRFSENTPNAVGSGPDWLFDNEALIRTMNYEPIVAGTQSNDFVGKKASDNAGQARKETKPVKYYILLPLWTTDPPFSQDPKSSQDDGSKPSSDDGKKVDKDPRKENECIELPVDPNMPSLEDISIFDFSRIDEDDDAEADINNLDTTIQNLVDLPNGKRAIGTKWVFKNKKDERGIMIRNKAILVAQGYTQEERIHYDEVFAPVVRIKAIRIFLAYASFKDFMVYKMDVKSAFLYGKIEEEVYVCQQPGFEDPNFPNRVYKVEKALYGLHQARRAWYETLSTYLLENEFQRGKIDKTLFIRRHKGDILLVQVYVDDIIFVSTKKELCNAFEKLSMIGSLMYLTSSRPEIMFAVCSYARYQVNPNVSHLYAVKRFLAYTDSDYARASLDKKSTIGGCQFLGSRLISWQCKKQTMVANSTTEAEYVVASSCYGQVLWIQNQLLDYGYALMINPTIYISCIEQFWATVKVKTVNGEVHLQALVDGKKIIITESTVRRDLQLEDAEGVDCLPNATIFEQLTLMGSKTTAWNEFSSTIVSAIICLATNHNFNFSKYIFESMVKNLDNMGKFFMYLRFIQVFLDKQLEGMPTHNRIYIAPSHTKKIFGNMRRVGKGFSGRETPLFQTMVVQAQAELGKGSANATDPHHIPTIIHPSTSQPQKKQRPRKLKRKDTEIPQSSGPTENVADEAVNEEMDNSLERAATIATSLDAEQDRGNINKTQSKATPNEAGSLGTTSAGGPRHQETMGDTIAQTRFENVSKTSNDPMIHCSQKTTKTTQANEITSLKRRVKKLERRNKSRTHRLKIMYKVSLTARVESSRDEDLGEDASKQGRSINAIDADEDITPVNDQDDAYMFGVNDLDGDEVIVDNVDVVKAAEETVNATATTTIIITDVEVTLAQALAELKSVKPKAVKVVIQEPEQGTTTTTPTTIIYVPKPPQDKGKGIMIEQPMVEQVKPMKRLEQIRLDEELAFKLQAEEEEERLDREKAHQTKESNIAWDDIQAKIKADYWLA
ncbi:putative ribonuclease H-like domain-containing protein [Tanacetum coccineum]